MITNFDNLMDVKKQHDTPPLSMQIVTF